MFSTPLVSQSLMCPYVASALVASLHPAPGRHRRLEASRIRDGRGRKPSPEKKHLLFLLRKIKSTGDRVFGRGARRGDGRKAISLPRDEEEEEEERYM